MPDVTDQFSGLRGDAYVEALRAVAIISSARGGHIRCGGTGCRKPAEYIGMQRCGAPGGPICADCLDAHRQWMSTTADISEYAPYCRHCNEDVVDRGHIYAVNLWDGAEVIL